MPNGPRVAVAQHESAMLQADSFGACADAELPQSPVQSVVALGGSSTANLVGCDSSNFRFFSQFRPQFEGTNDAIFPQSGKISALDGETFVIK